MLKAVVFDLDGTLLNTIPDIAGALNRALAACGYPTHSTEKCKTFIGGGIFHAIRQALPPECGEEDVLRVHKIHAAYYLQHCAEETDYYPGVERLLTQLAERGVKLGVLSNKTEELTCKIVEHYFPEVPFACVFGRVDSRPLKPDAAAVEPVLQVLGLQSEEIAYVGDSGSDMVFAKNAGMLPVAAPWGYRSREDLVSSGAQYVPDCPLDILNIL